jgi:hypothetical protein
MKNTPYLTYAEKRCGSRSRHSKIEHGNSSQLDVFFMLTFLLRLHEGLTSAKVASRPPKIEHLTLQFLIFGTMLTLLHAGFGSEFRIQ